MRVCPWKPIAAACVGLLLGFPITSRAWQGFVPPIPLPVQPIEVRGSVEFEPEAAAETDDADGIPPWGRELGEPGPLAETGVGAIDLTQRFWFNVDALMWWTRNGSAPPLITRGDLSDPRPGALEQAYTKVLYGGSANDVNFEDRYGGRFTCGMALDAAGDYGVEASYLFLTARATGTAQASPGNPVLAQPFYNTLTNANDSAIASYPGQLTGSISVRSTSLLQGAEVNGTARLWQLQRNWIALVAGIRYLNLEEDLQVGSVSIGDPMIPMTPGPLFAGKYFAIEDRFHNWNDFYGGQLGITSQWTYRRIQLNLLAKIAVGDTHEISQIAGSTQTNYPTLRAVPAGLLALSSNSGTFNRDTFAVVPEVGANLGLRITDRLTLAGGYTFLYWSQVARPGSQVDLTLNPNLIPTSTTFGAAGGPARPASGIRGTDFWAQGLNLSLLWNY